MGILRHKIRMDRQSVGRDPWLLATFCMRFIAMAVVFSLAPTHAAESVEDTKSTASSSKKSYVVHVGAFSKPANARAIADKIKTSGIIADQNEIEVYENDGLTKVRLGPYTDRSKIAKIMTELKNRGVASMLGNNPASATARGANIADKKSAPNVKPGLQQHLATEKSTAGSAVSAANTLEAMQIRLEELDARNAQLQQRLQQVEQRLTPSAPTVAPQQTTEQQNNTADASDVPASADNAAAAAKAGPGEFEVDEDAAGRALERTLVQSGALLLPFKQVEIETSLAYVRNEGRAPVFFADGDANIIAQQTIRQNIIDADLQLRIGMPFESQLELGIPYRYLDSSAVTEVFFPPKWKHQIMDQALAMCASVWRKPCCTRATAGPM